MNRNGNTTLIEQKTTLPNPFDAFLDSKSNRIFLNDSSLPKITTYKEYSNDDSRNSPEVSLSSSKKRLPNFPSFMPIVYHSIGLEIPQQYSFIIRICYYSALSFSYVHLFTFFSQLFSSQIDSLLIIRWKELISSFFILLVCPAALFYVQYFPIYNAIRDEKPNVALVRIQYFVIFVFFFFFLGIPGSGSIGLVYLTICNRCGSVITRFLAFVITVWHFFNLVTEVIILFMLIPLNCNSQQQKY